MSLYRNYLWDNVIVCFKYTYVFHCLRMSIKQKFLNAVSPHPKLAAFAIGLAITMAVETAIGMIDNSHLTHVFQCYGCNP